MSRYERTGWKKETPLAILQVVTPGVEVWRKEVSDGILSVLRSKDDGKWHLSISHKGNVVNGKHQNRYPTWDEIHQARYEFLPNELTVAMILPPKEQYVNFHDTTFHLWEIESDENGEKDGSSGV